MGEWEFYHYRDGRWTWRNTRQDETGLSERAFDSWIEAMADAMNRGFALGESKLAADRESRRSHPRVQVEP